MLSEGASHAISKYPSI